MFGNLLKSPPSVQEYIKEKNLCQQISKTLSFIVNHLQADFCEKIIERCDLSNSLASVLEAILLHQASTNLNNGFWKYVCKYTHHDTIMRIKKLNRLKNPIGLSRAWIRVALNENLFESYLYSMIHDKHGLSKCYSSMAFMNDSEQVSLLQTHVQCLSELKFNVSFNCATLNCWSQMTLILLGQSQGNLMEFFNNLNDKKIQEESSIYGKQNSLIVVNKVKKKKKTRSTEPSIASEDCGRSIDSFKSSSLSLEMPVEFKFKNEPDLVDNTTNCSITVVDVSCGQKIDNDEANFQDDIVLTVDNSFKENSPPDNDSNIISVGTNNNINDIQVEYNDINVIKENNEKPESDSETEDISLSIYDKDYQTKNPCDPEIPISENKRSSVVSYGNNSETKSCLRSEKSLDMIGFEVIDNITKNEEEFAYQFSLVDQLCYEKGLDSQNYKCRQCQRDIGIIYGFPRICWFDKAYYCTECHVNDDYYIPSRILYNWDFNKYPISKSNLNFVKTKEKTAMFNLKTTCSKLYEISDNLKRLRDLRQQLFHCKSYLFSCSSLSTLEEFQKRVWPNDYYYNEIDTYSLSDLLLLTSSDNLENKLHNLFTFAKKHIFECKLCFERGFYCEICRANSRREDILFPFQIEKVVICRDCKAVFHKNCKRPEINCPRCQRRRNSHNRRNMAIHDDGDYAVFQY